LYEASVVPYPPEEQEKNEQQAEEKKKDETTTTTQTNQKNASEKDKKRKSELRRQFDELCPYHSVSLSASDYLYLNEVLSLSASCCCCCFYLLLFVYFFRQQQQGSPCSFSSFCRFFSHGTSLQPQIFFFFFEFLGIEAWRSRSHAAIDMRSKTRANL
jgi:hypothetical protein